MGIKPACCTYSTLCTFITYYNLFRTPGSSQREARTIARPDRHSNLKCSFLEMHICSGMPFIHIFYMLYKTEEILNSKITSPITVISVALLDQDSAYQFHTLVSRHLMCGWTEDNCNQLLKHALKGTHFNQLLIATCGQTSQNEFLFFFITFHLTGKQLTTICVSQLLSSWVMQSHCIR